MLLRQSYQVVNGEVFVHLYAAIYLVTRKVYPENLSSVMKNWIVEIIHNYSSALTFGDYTFVQFYRVVFPCYEYQLKYCVELVSIS